MDKLTENDLLNISGGALTPAAEGWVSRNKSEIVNRAPSYLKGMVDVAIDYVKGDSTTYDIPDLQALLLGYGVDTYDLS